MLRESLGQEGAERLIAKVDGERACYLKANYAVDWEQEQLYDLSLNTGNLTYDQVIDILLPGLADKDKLSTPEAKIRVRDMALAYRLKARVATDPRLLVPTLEVTMEDGNLVMSGIIHTPKEENLLKEIAREVCGDRTVRFDLHRRA
jgi:hypothetical protein